MVMEGRDIGTVVFPDAELKIFLDASPETRAERRWKEHQEKGEVMTLAEVLEEVRERDKRDRERKVSPLVRAADAVLVDNTAMGIEETARLIVMLAREREKGIVGQVREDSMIRSLAADGGFRAVADASWCCLYRLWHKAARRDQTESRTSSALISTRIGNAGCRSIPEMATAVGFPGKTGAGPTIRLQALKHE